MSEEAPVSVPKLGMKFTVDGEVPVSVVGNKVTELPMPQAMVGELPPKFGVEHRGAMRMLAYAIAEVKKMEKRQIPVLRDELINFGVTKHTLKDLERFGFVTVRIIQILNTEDNNKPTGGRAVVYPTPRGRAFLEELSNELKAVPSSGDSEGEGVPGSGA